MHITKEEFIIHFDGNCFNDFNRETLELIYDFHDAKGRFNLCDSDIDIAIELLRGKGEEVWAESIKRTMLDAYENWLLNCQWYSYNDIDNSLDEPCFSLRIAIEEVLKFGKVILIDDDGMAALVFEDI